MTAPPTPPCLGASRESVPAELLDRLLLDPDAETLQFITQASVPTTGLPGADDAQLQLSAICTPGVYGTASDAGPTESSPPTSPSTSWRDRVRERLHRR